MIELTIYSIECTRVNKEGSSLIVNIVWFVSNRGSMEQYIPIIMTSTEISMEIIFNFHWKEKQKIDLPILKSTILVKLCYGRLTSLHRAMLCGKGADSYR